MMHFAGEISTGEGFPPKFYGTIAFQENKLDFNFCNFCGIPLKFHKLAK